MLNHRFVFVAARLSFGLFVLMTSLYCLLAYIPFTYHHFLQFSHLYWLTVFAKLHPLVYWLVFGVTAASLKRNLRDRETKRLTVEFLIFHALVGILLAARPLFPLLRNNYISLIWSLVTLFPMIWLGIIDYKSYLKKARWPEHAADDARAPLVAGLLSGGFLALLYVAIFLINSTRSASPDFSSAEKIMAISTSLVSHLAVFTLFFALLAAIRAVLRLFSTSSKADFYLCSILSAALCMVVIRKIVLPTLTLSNSVADLYSIAVSFSLLVFLTAMKLRCVSEDRVRAESGLGIMLSALAPRRVSARFIRIAWLCMLAACAYLVPVLVARTDWDFIVQKLLTMIIWAMTFAFFYATVSRARPARSSVALVATALAASLGIYGTLGPPESLLPRLLKDDGLNIQGTLDRYAGHDISFKVAREIITPSLDDDSFYSMLKANTNLPPSTEVDPVDIELAPKAATPLRRKPNIFLFVIDSLRQDYLSPYNEKVNFTPAIERFARESVVMKNSFTRYSGTGLAQPSIWVGGLMLHKQYVTPFYPMNALQKLIDEEGYQSYVSMDKILSVVMRQSPDIIQLDRDLSEAKNVRFRAEYKYDLCRTLTELRARLDERQGNARPVFAYTQPQNLHINVLLDRPALDGGPYPEGFADTYASHVKRLDACFGEFIEYLKASGLYDDSIVIITSDHGDSLGEDGRWGHALWLFPEIMRIPLLIHLPESMRQGVVWDPEMLAFSTDITPSLYYLFGRRPIVRSEMFGRPLFTATIEEQAQYLRESYMLCSSYGPTFGILKDNGKYFYIVDGVDQRDYFFDLGEDPMGKRNLLNAHVRAENQELIRSGIQSINKFYNFGTKQEVASLK